MIFALNMMSRLINDDYLSDQELDIACRLYESEKESIRTTISEMAKSRPPISDITRKKLSKLSLGRVPVTDLKLGINTIVPTEVYHDPNNDRYIVPWYGRKHTEETKRLMAKNGIRNKVAYTSIITNEVIYRHPNFKSVDFVRGNLVLGKLTSERLKGTKFWTNTKTGEVVRSRSKPGPEWENRRKFNNAMNGVSVVFNLYTGEQEMIPPEEKKYYHVSNNRVLFLYKDILFLTQDNLRKYISKTYGILNKYACDIVASIKNSTCVFPLPIPISPDLCDFAYNCELVKANNYKIKNNTQIVK